MHNWIHHIIDYQEQKSYSLYTVLIFAIFVGLARSLLEVMLAHRLYLEIHVLNNCIFYFLMIWGFTLALTSLTNMPWRKVIMPVLLGILLGLLPPLIDVFIYGIGGFKYTYHFGTPTILSLTMFDRDHGFPFGEGLTLWLGIIFGSYYIYLKTTSAWRTLIGAILLYGVLLISGLLLPSLGHLIYRRLDLTSMTAISLLQVMLSIIFYLALNPTITYSLLKRSLHCMPFVLITFVGGAVAGEITPLTLLMAILVLTAGLTTLVQNDFYDMAEDAISGRKLVINKDDVNFFNCTFLALAFIIYHLNSLLFLPLIMMFTCSVLYNYDFYRAKRYFPANYQIEGLWGLGSFLCGILSQPKPNFNAELIIYCVLVFAGWSLVSTFKDGKDIEADKAVGNQTAYLMLMKLGLSLRQAHISIATISIICFACPAIWLCFQNVPLAICIGFPLLSLPPLLLAFKITPGKRGVVSILYATIFHLSILLTTIIIYYQPNIIPF